jgi:hypothetical protein
MGRRPFAYGAVSSCSGAVQSWERWGRIADAWDDSIKKRAVQSRGDCMVDQSTMGAPALCIRRGLIVVRSGSIVRKR